MEQEQKVNKEYYWRPITFEYLLEKFSLASVRVMGVFLLWIVVIALALWGTLAMIPQNWVSVASQNHGYGIIHFFLFNPALLLGVLLFFWLGFEWGFTPVFLSSFMLAFHSGLEWHWAIIFGVSYVLGIAICGTAYHAFRVNYNLRSFNSIVFFISIMFIGSISSSLGAFIWSFSQNLTAYKTLVIWKSWWSGTFMQALLIIGPFLFFFSPWVERLKERLFHNPEFSNVSKKWVFGAVSSITGALALFILSGRYLGRLRVKEVMRSGNVASVADVISALESFELITWISIGIIVITGFGAFVLLSGWNKTLQEEVDSRTKELKESQDKLEESLDEKKILLKEIHHRVKNNMALMGALLELQDKVGGSKNGEETLRTARSRIQSMAMAHEALYQTETFSDISMKNYLERIAESTHNSFKNKNVETQMRYDLEDISLELEKAVPLGLMINEILINAFKHAFEGREEGTIGLESNKNDDTIEIKIWDNGVGLTEDKEKITSSSLGMTLIKRFSKQLHGDLSIDGEDGEGTVFTLRFDA